MAVVKGMVPVGHYLSYNRMILFLQEISKHHNVYIVFNGVKKLFGW